MQTRILSALTLAVALATAESAAAQGRVQIERREGPPEASIRLDSPRMTSISLARRARLGVTLDMSASDNDKYGATIDAVTPGSAAAKAGLRAGDVITALDGKSLVAGDAPRNGDADASAPGLRLVEMAAKLGGGDTITVAYRRGDDARTTRLITDDDNDAETIMMRGLSRRPGTVNEFFFRGPRGNGAPMPPRPPLPPELANISPDMIETVDVRGEGNGASRINIMLRGGISDLELVSLNPDLGRYFGTTEGVLVVNTPKDPAIGLKGGDVVFAVDGRKVTGPAQLQRILRTYEPGESIKFDVQRDRKRDAVSGKVPERKSAQWRYEVKPNDEE